MPSRRLIRAATCAIMAASLSALALSACAGPGQITQEQARALLLTSGELPTQGWSPGPINEVAPPADPGAIDLLLQGTTGLSEACRTALKTLNAPVGTPTAFATVTYSKAATGLLPTQDLMVSVQGFETPPPVGSAIPDAVRACPRFEVTQGAQTLSVLLTAPTYATAGAVGYGMSISSDGLRTELDTVRAVRGRNLVTVSINGDDAEANAKLLDAALSTQVRKLEAL